MNMSELLVGQIESKNAATNNFHFRKVQNFPTKTGPLWYSLNT